MADLSGVPGYQGNLPPAHGSEGGAPATPTKPGAPSRQLVESPLNLLDPNLGLGSPRGVTEPFADLKALLRSHDQLLDLTAEFLDAADKSASGQARALTSADDPAAPGDPLGFLQTTMGNVFDRLMMLIQQMELQYAALQGKRTGVAYQGRMTAASTERSAAVQRAAGQIAAGVVGIAMNIGSLARSVKGGVKMEKSHAQNLKPAQSYERNAVYLRGSKDGKAQLKGTKFERDAQMLRDAHALESSKVSTIQAQGTFLAGSSRSIESAIESGNAIGVAAVTEEQRIQEADADLENKTVESVKNALEALKALLASLRQQQDSLGNSVASMIGSFAR